MVLAVPLVTGGDQLVVEIPGIMLPVAYSFKSSNVRASKVNLERMNL